MISYSVIIRTNFLEFPLERDEGLYVHFAELILEGKLPYASFYDPKPTGLFYIYAAIMFISGKSLTALHWAFTIINATTCYMTYQLSKKLMGRIAAVTSSLLFVILSLNPHLGGYSVLSEHLVIFLVVPSFLLLITGLERNHLSWIVLSGLGFGISIQAKQNGLFFALAGVVYLVYYHIKEAKTTQGIIIRLVYFGTMILVPSLLLWIYFTGNDLGGDFLYWNYIYGIKYLSNVPWSEALDYFTLTVTKLNEGYFAWWLISFASICSVPFLHHSRRVKVFLITFSVLSIISITPRWTFHGHYFILMIPALAIASGALIDHIVRQFKMESDLFFAGLGLVIITAIIVHTFENRDHLINVDHKRIIKNIYGSNPFVETHEISQMIRNRAHGADQLLVFGGEMQLYYYTGLRAPTKHLFGPYLVDASDEHLTRQNEYMHDAETHLPRFFIAIRHPLSWSVKKGHNPMIMTWYNDFTSKNYDLIGLCEIRYNLESKYYWDDDLDNHIPGGDHQIYVWELKKTPFKGGMYINSRSDAQATQNIISK